MSKELYISKAKPNPAGKDKAGNSPKPEQLLGEWVDIKNIGTEPVPFSGMSLTHTLFDDRCNKTGRVRTYWTCSGDGVLPVGCILRVHTGNKSDESLMKNEDKLGRDWWTFANESNNTCGDIVTTSWPNSLGARQTDTVSYDRNQPEGAVLVRSGNKLVLATGYGR
jgi:hypothetical protein